MRDLEELQHLVLWLGQVIPKGPHHPAGSKNFVFAMMGKESLDLFPGRGRGGSFFREGSQGPKAALLHRPSEIALNEAGHEICHVNHEHEGLDSFVVLEEHRGNLKVGFESAEALLDVGLLRVRVEDGFGGEWCIRDERKDSIDGLGTSELFMVFLGDELRNTFDGAMVRRLWRGFTAGCLCEGFLHTVYHGDLEPRCNMIPLCDLVGLRE